MAQAPLRRKRYLSAGTRPVFSLVQPVRCFLSMTKILQYTDYQSIRHNDILYINSYEEMGVVSSSVFVRLQTWMDSNAALLDQELRLHISCRCFSRDYRKRIR